ncbi:MAG: hypothetical protein K2Q17_00175 [Nitrospiraceae bacterium]|jgi:hypothetical protein|nr:hypothetical protein [Nitrospiraceae bacterium]
MVPDTFIYPCALAAADSTGAGQPARCATTEESMMHKFSLMLLWWVLLITPQLAVSGEPRYPILDSKFPAAEAKLGWIDNERVMFYGYDVGKMTQPGPGEGYPTAAEGLFIWDTGKGAITKYWDIDGPVPLCVFRGQVFFSKKLKEKNNTWLVVSGPLGKEEQKEVTAGVSMNGHSCRVSDHRPSWMKEDKYRRLPLLEEHGYLDFGIPVWVDPSGKATPIVLYKPDSKNGIELPLAGRQVQFHVTYVEFADVYLLKGEQRTSDAIPIWLLKPDGIVTKVLEPTGKSWEKMGWGHFYLTKKGLLLTGGRGDYGNVGTTGGYLLESGNPTRIIVGFVRNAVVSPDGCKMAFVHALHSQAEADSAKALREGRPGTRTLKIIDLCKGE